MAVAVLLFSTINLIEYQRKPELIYKRVVLGTSDNLEKRSEFWQNILSQTPDYLPGIIELAKTKNATGDYQSAKILLKKAEELNPNYKQLKEVQTSLAKQLH